MIIFSLHLIVTGLKRVMKICTEKKNKQFKIDLISLYQRLAIASQMIRLLSKCESEEFQKSRRSKF